jgi:RND superfamily putative drug exporter
MRRLLTFPAGRRAKWIVLIVGVLIAGYAGSFASKFEEAQENDPVSYLPGEAESVRTLEAVERFPSGELTPAVVVYRREGGLTRKDRRRVAADRAELNADRPEPVRRVPPPVVSRDRTTALLIANIAARGDEDVLEEATKEIRDRVGEGGGGLAVELTGPAGFSADAVEVFEQINGTLLIGTLALIFVLLILIYRSPIFWTIPLFSVVLAELTSRGLGYGLTEIGVTVNGQSAGILAVLVFGAGTDYALLLVSRYREELRKHEDKHDAMGKALRRSGPTIFASAMTVIGALLCLSLAEVNGTAGLGPIGAMGVALAMIAMLTVLPALLVICGRRAFWPFVPRYGGEGADETHGPWRRIGERVARRPRRVWLGATVVLGVMCLGLTLIDYGLTFGNSFREDVDSVQGQELIAKSFPAGINAPTNVVVGDPRRTEAVRRALADAPGVGGAGPIERGPPGARFDITLEDDPYSEAAYDDVEPLRDVAKRAGGPGTLVGGPTAAERDLRISSSRDNKVIVPIVLAVVFLILAALLRAVVAPLLLIATVILSFAAALGVGYFMFEHVFGFPGSDPAFPLFVFIFLVALGVDYNIFLMARVREEALTHGTRRGMIRGLAVTGGVITSAGIVLAGTFSVLAILPLVFLTELGFTIAFGILLDTFLVRSLLVPALVFDIGSAVWWPSRLAVRARDEERAARPEGVAAGAEPDAVGVSP